MTRLLARLSAACLAATALAPPALAAEAPAHAHHAAPARPWKDFVQDVTDRWLVIDPAFVNRAFAMFDVNVTTDDAARLRGLRDFWLRRFGPPPD